MKSSLRIALVIAGFLSLFGIVCLVALSTAFIYSSSHGMTQTRSSTIVDKPTIETLLLLTNKERTSRGIPPLSHDSRLDTSAQEAADDMVAKDYFAHIIPNTNEHNVSRVLKYVEPHECIKVSENIAKMDPAQNTSGDIMKAWMNSPKHRAALLNPSYDYVGFGIKDNIVVQHFCQLY